MKKLMVLGGSRYALPVIEAAHRLGIYVMFRWPVIVKPTDSAGSKGVTRVDEPKDLEKSIRYALS